ncbi:MAG: oligosaccharide flippase family protein [Spirochaetes bacterium]|nr:oligosaccharide flippase family protein [Spirochaetota bacterium]
MKNESTSLTKKFKQGSKDLIIYGIGGSLNKLVGIILVPIYTRNLSTSQYGLLGLLKSIISITSGFFLFGIASSFIRFYNDQNDNTYKKTLTSTVLIFLILNCFFIIIIGILFSKVISFWLFKTEDHFILIILTFIISGLSLIRNIPFSLYRITLKSIKFISFEMLFFLLTLCLIIIFVVYYKLNIFGILLAKAIILILSLVVLLFDIRKYITFKFSFYQANKLFKYGFPLAIAAIASFIITYIDRYMIYYFLNLEEVGIYNLAYQFGLLISLLLLTPLKKMWGPLFLSHKNDNNFYDFVKKTLTYIILLGGFIFLTISLLSKEIIILISNKDYWDAYKIVPILALSYFIWSLRPIFETGIILKRKTKMTLLYTLIGAISNILLNLILIPIFKTHGAALATCLTFLIMIILSYVINQKYLPVKYEFLRIIKIFFIICIIFFLGYYINITNILLSILFKVILIIIFPFLLLIIRFFDKEEINIALKFIRLKK